MHTDMYMSWQCHTEHTPYPETFLSFAQTSLVLSTLFHMHFSLLVYGRAAVLYIALHPAALP